MTHATLEEPAPVDLDVELDRQQQLLLDSGAAGDADLDAHGLADAVDRLRPALRAQDRRAATPSAVPVVLVLSSGDPVRDLVAAERQVLDLRLAGGRAAGVLDRNHGEAGLRPTDRSPRSALPRPGSTHWSASSAARSSAGCRRRPHCRCCSGAAGRR